jgi:cytochrome c oxidase cbb3-type subunit III
MDRPGWKEWIGALARIRTLGLALAVGAAWPLGSCEREARPFESLARPSASAPNVTQSPLHPGGSASGTPMSSQEGPYHRNAWGMAEGKRLYNAYNCSGCHANGGGGMGPPLMDDRWIYGSAPANIYQTIVEGRPNGMPSFRGKIPSAQVWMLVAYVESMSGQAPIDVMPGRSDHMRAGTPENARRAETPKQTGPR